MRALAYGADGSFVVVDRPDPEPGPGMVVVAVGERAAIEPPLEAGGMKPVQTFAPADLF